VPWCNTWDVFKFEYEYAQIEQWLQKILASSSN